MLGQNLLGSRVDGLAFLTHETLHKARLGCVVNKKALARLAAVKATVDKLFQRRYLGASKTLGKNALKVLGNVQTHVQANLVGQRAGAHRKSVLFDHRVNLGGGNTLGEKRKGLRHKRHKNARRIEARSIL